MRWLKKTCIKEKKRKPFADIPAAGPCNRNVQSDHAQGSRNIKPIKGRHPVN